MTETFDPVQLHELLRRGLVRAADVARSGPGREGEVGGILLDTLSEAHSLVVRWAPGVCAGKAETAPSLRMTGLEIPLFPEPGQ